MPSDKVMDLIPDKPNEDADEQESEDFAEIGFESNFMIINLGTMFLAFIIILLMPVLLFLTLPCKKWPSFEKKHNSCKESMSGNIFIRFFLESCLDIAICGSLNQIYAN